MGSKSQVMVGGVALTLSNLEKVLYPEAGFTKGDIISYYERIAPVMLPHLHDRPLTMKRFPEGVKEEYFYHKQCPFFRPDWMSISSIRSDKKNKTVDYCVVNDLASLLWVVNLASIELHVLLSCRQEVTRPTMLVFDLDPGEPADIFDSARTAFRMKEIFETLALQTYIKTSGGKGLHLYVPLNTPTTFDQTKSFAHALAQMLARDYPDEITANMRKSEREGKVFVDWSQNDRHKTTVCVYSLRAGARPTVSMPVTWEELEKALHKQNSSMLTFEAEEALVRVGKVGDLFAPVLKLEQHLPTLPSAKQKSLL